MQDIIGDRLDSTPPQIFEAQKHFLTYRLRTTCLSVQRFIFAFDIAWKNKKKKPRLFCMSIIVFEAFGLNVSKHKRQFLEICTEASIYIAADKSILYSCIILY
jgi:hypothetical protein